MKLIILVSAIILNCRLLVVSCSDKPTHERNKPEKVSERLFGLTSPQNGKTVGAGEKITVSFKATKPSVIADSCIFNIDGKRVSVFARPSFDIDTDGLKMGVRRMSLNIYAGGESVETIPFAVKIIPTIAPKQFGYVVTKEYPHDVEAYTQGLFYHNGFVYEGTGQKGKSSLRKTELSTGKILQSVALDEEYFGEGICLHHDKIYQLTWRNRKGFIYDIDDFALKARFDYASEGWGVASDGERLRMSDGTANIYTLDADNLSVTDQIEVWTNKGKVDNLNELEYIDGEIWANVYTEDYIVRIDPKTGRVTGTINLKGLLKKELHKPDTDVLNGIAYDQARKRIFVTGKNWPLLFEIKLVEKVEN